MLDRISEISTNKIARLIGILWLAIIVAGVNAEFVVRESLIVSGNAAETAANIVESEALFRIGMIGDLSMIAFDVAVAVLLLALLRPVSPILARFSAWFRLVQAAIIGASLLSLFVALQLLTDADVAANGSADQINALAMVFIEVHAIGYDLALVFFSLSIAALSYVLYRSRLTPSVFAVLLGVASIVYMGGSLVHILAPENVDAYSPAYGVSFIAELALALWLSIKGVRSQAASERHVAATAS